jgi:hypothetical protein
MCEIVVIAVAVANMLPGEAQDRWLGIGPARKKVWKLAEADACPRRTSYR